MAKWLSSSLLGACIVAGAAIGPIAHAEKWNMPTRSNAQNYFTQNIVQFTQDVKKGTDGKLDIVVHPEDSLIKQPDVKRAVQTAQVQIGEVLMSIYSNESPIYGVDSIPFLASNFQEGAKLLEAARPIIAERLKKQGIRLLFVVPWPPNSFYSQKQLSSVADLKGVKFRAFNPVTGRLAELMGAIPVTVQQSEVSQAFSTGVIDAMITSPATGVDTQAWDFVKYFTEVKAMSPWNIAIVNAKVFDKLDKKTQDVLLAASAQAEERGWKRAPVVTSELVKKLKDHGMNIEEPTEKMKGELAKIHEKLINEWLASAGPEGKKVIEQYRKAK
ncbi:MAG: TRAP transporter substrate-binding protein [Burkholderiaceae bacterium]